MIATVIGYGVDLRKDLTIGSKSAKIVVLLTRSHNWVLLYHRLLKLKLSCSIISAFGHTRVESDYWLRLDS